MSDECECDALAKVYLMRALRAEAGCREARAALRRVVLYLHSVGRKRETCLPLNVAEASVENLSYVLKRAGLVEDEE